MRKFYYLAAGALAAMAVAQSASASVVTFIGEDAGASAPGVNATAAAAAFDAAAGAVTLETFESHGGASTTFGITGATITGGDYVGSPQVVSNTPFCQPNLCGANTTSGGQYFLQLFGGSATFTFDSAISAFGAYFGGGQVNGISLNFNDGSSQSIALPVNEGFSFVGFTDSAGGISSVTINAQINDTGDIMSVDDVRFSSGAVPEPATWALMISGFGLAGGALRRRAMVRAAS